MASTQVSVWTDSKAAKAIPSRSLGKTRYVELQYLWLHDLTCLEGLGWGESQESITWQTTWWRPSRGTRLTRWSEELRDAGKSDRAMREINLGWKKWQEFGTIWNSNVSTRGAHRRADRAGSASERQWLKQRQRRKEQKERQRRRFAEPRW